MIEPVSLRQYAKRRGCTPMTVSVAIKHGRLKESVIYLDASGNPSTRDAGGVPKIRDVFLADREWLVNSANEKAPAASRAATVALAKESERVMEAIGTPLPELDGDVETDAAGRLKHWQAELAELKYRQAAKELVPVDEMRREVTDMIARAKVRILTIPSLLRQRLPHLTQTDSSIVDETLREALEELANDE